MKSFLEFNDFINKKIVWGIPMIILLIGVGLYLAIKSEFFVYRNFGYILKNTFGKIFKKMDSDEKSITAFQAVSTALAGTIGTGNIVGVALAISLGGPGAIFWMWLAAIIGMTTKVAEVTLAVATRKIGKDGKYVGGPMYYIERGSKLKWLSVLFCVFGIIAPFGTGALVQSNSIAVSLKGSFGLNDVISGIIIAFLMALVIIGGIKRIGQFAEKVVPLMSIFYIIGAIIVLIIQRKMILPSLVLIFESAFSPKAAGGAFAGVTILTSIRWGLARGIFTNEAGIGTAPIAHSTGHTDHPLRQGIWGAFEVFADTMIVCSLTALVILTSGIWKEAGHEAGTLTSLAFEQAIPFGKLIVNLGLILFAFTTAVSWNYYGERCLEYLTKNPLIQKIYRIVYISFCFIGAIGGLKFVWDVADTFNGLMAIPNLIGLFLCAKAFAKIAQDFYRYKGKTFDYNASFESEWKKYF